jgi:hypothetical protein
MNRTRISRVMCSIVLPVLFLGLGTANLLAQKADSEDISRLLNDAKTQSLQAEWDADQLVAYTRSGVSWQSHSNQLDRMKEHVNALGKLNKELRDQRDAGSLWQQTAIDRTTPLLQEMADTLTATIKHLNDHKSEIQLQQYRDYADANYEVANRMSRMVSDFVDYGKAKSRAVELEQKLEIPHTGA